jgi:hypothetical protein
VFPVETVTVTGQLERIVYQNGSTNFTVARIRTRDTSDSIAVVGNLVGIEPRRERQSLWPVGQ